jgi:hypothetical protein
MSEQNVSIADVGEAQETEPVVESVETEDKPEAPAAEDQPDGEQADEPAKPKPNKTDKYINKLRDQRSRLEGENAALRRQLEQKDTSAPVVPEGKPTRDQFQSDDEFIDALTDFKVDFKVAKAKEDIRRETVSAQTQNAWDGKVEAARVEYPDWDDVFEDARDVQIPKAMHEAITSSNLGPDILYRLAKDTSEANRLAKLSPVAMGREIGRIEAQIEYERSKPEETKPKLTNAPSPPKTVRANAAVHDIDVAGSGASKLSVNEWLRERNKQLQKQRR